MVLSRWVCWHPLEVIFFRMSTARWGGGGLQNSRKRCIACWFFGFATFRHESIISQRGGGGEAGVPQDPPGLRPELDIRVIIQTLFAHCFFHRPLTSKMEVLANSCKERIGFLEHVLVRVNLTIWPRGDLLLSLKSPSGTVSRLTQHRPLDRFKSVSTNLTNWNILTLHHWGEDPRGTWTLKADGDYG